MISIVCGTNRRNSVSERISDLYHDILAERRVDANVVYLKNLPADFVVSALYEKSGTDESFNVFSEVLKNSEKMVFIVPEYNGGFPGVLKAFIDGLKYPDTFVGKYSALVGLSSGEQGAGPALSHLTDIFNYCGMNVLADKPRLSHIEKHLTKSGLCERYERLLVAQAERLVQA